MISVRDLHVSFPHRRGPVTAVRGIDLDIRRGECVAVVGESGSGKSVTARALVGLAGPRAEVRSSSFEIDGRDVRGFGPRDWRRLRGGFAGLVLQDALVSLDPLRTVGAEIAEVLRVHGIGTGQDRSARVRRLLETVHVPEPARRAGQYPHQLSGGLRQRALIASAIAATPPLLIADEPTTALDVTVQAQILDLLAERRTAGETLLLISHDLAVVSRLADRVVVMRDGRIVESGDTSSLLAAPTHPYTRQLIDAVPSAASRGRRLSGPGRSAHPRDSEEPRMWSASGDSARRLDSGVRGARPFPDESASRLGSGAAGARPVSGESAPRIDSGVVASRLNRQAMATRLVAVAASRASSAFPGTSPRATDVIVEARSLSKRYGAHTVVDDVDLTVRRGEIVGLVGESGSGKTTVAQLLFGLTAPTSGTVAFEGAPWTGLKERRRRPRRRRLQLISQDPLSAFDPRWTVRRIIDEALSPVTARPGLLSRTSARSDSSSPGSAHLDSPMGGSARSDQGGDVVRLLERVGLGADVLDRYPRQLSGGQRQRVAIARALAPRPSLIICDEPVSALDVSVQAQVLDLLADIRADDGTALLFISHDLGVVHHLADRVLVMRDGAVVESGPVDDVFHHPQHEYTRALIDAVPTLEVAR